MTRDLSRTLAEWVTPGGFDRVGEVLIAESSGGFELRHHEDAGREDLALFTREEEARRLATNDDAGAFRPLKTAPNLRHGWRLRVAGIAGLRAALEGFYPAMLGVLRDHRQGTLAPVPLRETLGRQSGMYAVTRRLTDAQAQATIGEVCPSRGSCLKTILWTLAPGQPVESLPAQKFDPAADQLGAGGRPMPLLCHEACNLLVARAREVVKGS